MIMGYVRNQAKKVWGWFIEGAASDLRSAVVASVAGSLVALLTAYFFTQKPLEFSAYTSSQGYAQPLPALVSTLAQHKAKATFEFSPPELERTFVCEFSQIEATTAEGLLLSYLNKYPGCFSVSQMSATKFRIFIPPGARDLQVKGGNYLCRCLAQ